MPENTPTLSVADRLFQAARDGDIDTLRKLLDEHPEKLHVRTRPHEQTLLHLAAFAGHLPSVELLLSRGADVNARDDPGKGDNTYAMHWAAAAGHLDVVRRLADAGGDVIGHGDDHALDVIGWATGWDGCDDETHRKVADFLVSRGARHNIYSAMSINLADEVRRIVAADLSALARPMSRNENYQLPLHFAVRKNLPEMVALLVELGADPLGTDGSGYTAAAYANRPDVDRPLMEAIRSSGRMDLVAALALRDWDAAERMLREDPSVIESGGASAGALHLMAKRNDVEAVRWLLDHGANPNTLWAHWDAEVTPLHLAALHGHADVIRTLLAAGADRSIHDSKHDSDPLGWAEYSGKFEVVRILRSG